ncbi:ABC transporter permease [Vreelandella titanicae]|uniref:ABC transporter permease n=1 Tax=Vreelandella titanicae TaxID=664683 RepID=UPI001F48ED6D|nr:ABC transporter permease [Halomonas titanicae]MCE7521259.1 ABC transporter permease [Halomonas titanicae]
MIQHCHNISLFLIGSEAIANLRVLGRRSFLALLGIAVGCASIIALINIGHNAANESIQSFREMGTNSLIASIAPYQGTSALGITTDIGDIRKNVPDLAFAAPLILFSAEIRHSKKSYDANVVGSTPDIMEVMKLQVAQGRLLSEFDGSTTYIVTGDEVTRELDLRLGDRVQIGHYLFELVGILEPQSPNPLSPVAANRMIFMSMDSMSRLMQSPEIGSVVATVKESAQLETAAAALRRYLQDLFRGREIQILVPRQLIEGMARQSRTFSYLLAGMGAISLLVGGVGVMNVMLMNVSERRREIGIRMAIGARARDIRHLFLFEALSLSLMGSVIGAATGIMIAYCFVYFSGWTFSLSQLSVPLGVLGSMATGLFFGLYPAISAARLHPMKALRDD